MGNAWRVRIFSDRAATWADAQQLTFDQAQVEFLDLSPDGQKLIVSSDPAGSPDLWILPAAGGEMQQLTSDPTPDWNSAFSPDGREIAFYAYRSGNREIWVQPAGGGEARKIVGDPSFDGEPAWLPDGAWLAFSSNRSGQDRISRVPSTGGRPEPVTRGAAFLPRWAPDGNWIYFLQGPDAGLRRVTLDGKTERALTDLVSLQIYRLERGECVARDEKPIALRQCYRLSAPKTAPASASSRHGVVSIGSR